MKKISKNIYGFTAVEGLLIILVLAVIGFGGYYVWHKNHKTTPSSTNSSDGTSSQNAAVTTPKFNPSVSLTAPDSYVSTSIPAVACDTTNVAGAGSVNSNNPTSEVVDLPKSLNNLSYYYSTGDALAVIAPTSWTCDVFIYQDGSEDLAVSSNKSLVNNIAGPNSYSNSSQPKISSSTNVQLVAISNTGACEGSCLNNSIVCTYFPSLLTNQVKGGLGSFSCPSKIPNGEIGSTLNSTVAYFGDPAKVAGSGYYSGGINPDIGILTYNSPSPSDAAEYFADCVLPTSEDNICNAIMTNFAIKNLESSGSKVSP